jgi:hypothetical protein
MALSARALITLDDARAYLTLEDGDIDDDGELAALIEAASAQIMGWTERQFAPTAAAATRVFAYDHSGFLSLANNDLRTVTSITIGIENPVTLTSSEYALRPKPSRDGVYTHLLIYGHRFPGCYGYHQHGHAHARDTEVTITGDWGYATVPKDVELACKMQVAVWQRKDRMAFTRAYNPDSGTVEGGDGLAGSVKALLAGGGYRKTAVG